VTLSLSNEKVPRWFTEGISMMEERQAGEGWGDYLNVGFVQAYKDDVLLPLKDLNSGFERPKSGQALTIAYFQAGWICEFLVSRYGFDSIAGMLEAFGQGLSTEEVFQQVLGTSVEEIDGRFRQEMEDTLKPLLSKLEAPENPSPVHLLPGRRRRGSSGNRPGQLAASLASFSGELFPQPPLGSPTEIGGSPGGSDSLPGKGVGDPPYSGIKRKSLRPPDPNL
jgi:hypothetical protein